MVAQTEQNRPGGEKSFGKTFLVDGDRKAISAGSAISWLLHKRGYRDDWDHINIPLFEDPGTGKEITIVNSRKLLEEKVKEAVLSPQHIKRHLVMLGRTSAYAKSSADGSITSGFLGLRPEQDERTGMHTGAHWILQN